MRHTPFAPCGGESKNLGLARVQRGLSLRFCQRGVSSPTLATFFSSHWNLLCDLMPSSFDEGKRLQPPWGTHRPGALATLAILASRHTVLGRGPLKRALFRLFKATHRGPVDLRVDGRPMRLHPARNVSERKTLLRPDRHDPVEKSLLRRAISSPDAIFLDIGANAGLYSLEAAVAARTGSQIIAVEPNLDLISRLRFNETLARSVGLIAPSTVIETYPVAISDQNGRAFLGHAEMEGSRCLSLRSGHLVQTKTLTSLTHELGIERITALKIDVEGYEDRVLVPFLMTAADAMLPSLVIMEHGCRHLWSTDCLSVCEGKGYRVIARTRNNTILTLQSANPGWKDFYGRING